MAGVDNIASIFIDTSTFEALGFAFDGPLLTAVASHGKNGNLRLLMPETTSSEVEARIRTRVREACGVLQAARKKAYLLRGCGDPSVAGLFAEPDEVAVSTLMIKRFREWSSGWWVKRIEPPPDTLKVVFEDYFAARPPFGDGKKKSEFPDAVALRCLRHSSSTTPLPIHMFTEDEDFAPVFNGSKEFVRGVSLEGLLNSLTQRADEIRLLVESKLNDHWKALDEWAKELAGDLTFEVSDEASAEVDVVEVKEAECLDLEVIDADGEMVSVSFNVSISLEAGVSVGHPADPEAYQTWITGATARQPATLLFSLKASDPLEYARFEFDENRASFKLNEQWDND